MTRCKGPSFSLTRSDRNCLYFPLNFSPLQKLMIGLTSTEGLGLRIICPYQSFIYYLYSFYMQSAYLVIIYLLAIASLQYIVRQLGQQQNTSSTFISSKGFSQASRPTMHPCRLFSSTIYFAFSTLFIPPLIQKLSSGKSCFSLQTRSYIKGGMVLFCAGFSPLRNAFLACMTKCLISPLPLSETSLIKLTKSQYVSNSSTPNLHLTVHFILTALAIASMHSLTRVASFIRHAPKEPF